MTAYSDFIVLTGYGVWLLCAGLSAVFNAERYEGTREVLG